MSLKDLPNYLDSVRRTGDVDDSVVVDMGQIIESKNNWMRNFNLSVVAILLLGIGIVSYSSTNNIKIVANDLSAEEISEIVSSGGGRVISVKTNEGDTYEVKLFSLNVKSLLEKLRKRKEINKVEID
jgi:hypothetical protein